jgi:hypothetical protein
MKLFLTLAVLTIFSACKPTTTVETAASTGPIKVTAPYLWPSSAFPRNLQLSKKFSSDEKANIRSMTAQWESVVKSQIDFFIDTNETEEVSDPKVPLDLDALGDDYINGIYKIDNWPKGLSPLALAVTQIFGRRFNIGQANEYVRIEHADILINTDYYAFRTDDSSSSWTYDFRTVVLHELGHFLGLGHKEGDSVMIPSISPGTTNQEPTNIDISDIADKYKITLPMTLQGKAMVAKPLDYSPGKNDSGQMVKIMIELLADGECVHKENGAVVRRHFLR